MVTQILEMKLLGSIFDTLMNVGVIALIVLFQDEIRRFLLTLGSHRHVSALAHFFSGARKEALKHDDIMPVVMACLSMGKQKVGALIVIEHTTPLDEVVRTGEIIDAAISQRLIENIFFKNSPLHDGAMVISKKRIKAAGCILPVSHDLNIPKELGLRHRAAMGISQKSDAHAIIVSEDRLDVHYLNLVGAVKDPVGQPLRHRNAGDGGHHVIEALQVLHVDGGV